MLEARVAAQRSRTMADWIGVLGAVPLAAAYLRTITDLAQADASMSAPAQRALEAQIEEAATPIFRAFDAQRAIENRLARGPVHTVESLWSEWIEALRDSCAAIDAAFPVIRELVVRAAQ